jgi:hypothetical protein
VPVEVRIHTKVILRVIFFIPDILENCVFVPDTEYRQSVPGLCSVGENVSSTDPFKIAVYAMKCVSFISVKSSSKTPIVVQPFQVTTISGLVMNKDGVCTALSEAIEKPQLSGLNICPRIVSLENAETTSRIPVRVCYMTVKVIKIKPNSVFCSLS